MKNRLSLNAILFSAVVIAVALFSYVVDEENMRSTTKPWHMQLNEHGDELSSTYLERYKLLDHGKTIAQLDSFDGTSVLILVDAWGVPYEEQKMAESFALFDGVPHDLYLHKRLLNYTKYAEQSEFRTDIPNAIYLFNGDSAEYNRQDYVTKMGYEQILFCQKADESLLLEKVDSLLKVEERPKIIAVSLQSSRQGNPAVLSKTLKKIAQFSSRWNDVRFVVQGSHRPVLVPRSEREQYYAYWVPVIVIRPENSK